MRHWYVTLKYLVTICHIDHVAAVQRGHLQQPLRHRHRVTIVVTCKLHSQFHVIGVESLNDIFMRRPHMPQFSPRAFRMAPLVVALILPPRSAFMSVERLILAFFANAACVSPASNRACLMM